MMLVFVLLILNIVVEFFSHGVVKGETLVGTKDVADETQAKGEVGTESLECIGNGLASRTSRYRLRVLREMHREKGVLGINGGCLSIILIRHRVNRIEGARDIIGFVLDTRVQLGHIRNVYPSVVPESNAILDERKRLTLENILAQLNLIRNKLRVHFLTVPKEVL